MTRLIDADALLEAVKVIGNRPLPDVRTLKDLEQAIVNTYHAILNEITNAPTVQREGWVSVPRKLPYDEMRQVIVDYFDELKDGRRVLIEDFWNELLQAAPKE